MDDLLTLASELIEGDAYQKDDFAEETKPDGTYATIIEDVDLKVSAEKGTEWFAFKNKVTEGDYAGEDFRVNLFLTEKTVKRSLSKIMRLINGAGYEIDVEMFNSKESILEGLKALIGTETPLTKETSKNGFVNYSFKGEEE